MKAATTTMISARHLAWFDTRGIDPETVTRFGIYSARRELDGGEVVQDPAGSILVFPYADRLSPVEGAKYRAPDKRFWQKPGVRKTFWNADILDDPALRKGDYALVITEGEMDALAVIQAGYPFVVSVPDGAPPARDKDGKKILVPKGADDIDPEHDEKYSFVFNNWDRLKQIKRIIVATDADEPGQRLAEELVRRLDRLRCSWVEMPKGCKDLNDVLVVHGSAEVLRIITSAKEYPVSGLYRYNEIPEEPDIEAYSTGWQSLDPLIKVFTPALMVVTGFAGQGKSTWTEQLVANLAINYGWVTAIASFEMRVKPYVTNSLATSLIRKQKWRKRPDGSVSPNWTPEESAKAESWLERHFVFIGPDPQNDDQEHDIDWLIDCAEAAVIRHGVRVLLVDPWNEIDHGKRSGESTTDYTGRAIRKLKRFAKQYGVLVVIVAHPAKSAIQKTPEAISLYDISDSAHFANKADIGVVIARLGNIEHDTLTACLIKKVRYQPETGKPGRVDLDFDPETRLFIQ